MVEKMRFLTEEDTNKKDELSIEQQNIVGNVSREIIEEKGENRFTEIIDDLYIDNMISRYIEKSIELDPMIKRSLQRAVRRAVGLPLE